MSNRYYTPQPVTPFTRALASGVNVNLTGLDAAFEAVQLEIDSGADIQLGPNLLSSDPAKGSALVQHGSETVKAVLDKLIRPDGLALAGTLTGTENLALFNGTTLVNLTLSRLAYAVTDQRAQFKNGTAGSFGEIGAASNDRTFALGVRSSTHSLGELAYLTTPSAIPMAFFSGGSERMRIAADGKVGINKSTGLAATLDVNGTIIGTAGVCALLASNGGGSGQTSIGLKREGAGLNDQRVWEMAQFADGSFAVRTVNDTYSGSHAAITLNRGSSYFHDNTVLSTNGIGRWRLTVDGNFIAVTDNQYNLGFTGNRVANLYAANGSIITSDEREKAWRGKADEAELRVARRIIDELGFYQWNDAIEKKGPDGARLNFGVRAQRVFAIFTEEGLDPTRYAFLCYDEWPEKREPVMAQRTIRVPREVEYPSRLLGPDGNPVMRKRIEYDEVEETYDTGETRVVQEAGDRYGVRPDQLALFLIAALAHG